MRGVSDLSPFYVLLLSHGLLQNELEKMNAKKGKETDSEQCYFRWGKVLSQKMNILRVYALFSAFSKVGHRTC